MQQINRAKCRICCAQATVTTQGSETFYFPIYKHTFPTHGLSVTVLTFITLIAYGAFVECILRDVNLIIEPPAVRRGQHAILYCCYDMDDEPLYSTKFYRGQLEFYRFTPGELPNTKVFPFPGIHVDISNSNATQVLIRNVGFGLSGNFSCEVTADAPLFSTATAVRSMQVVELPDKHPQLFTEQSRYEVGEVLRANCSTPPSRPRTELRFTINNMLINDVDMQYIRTMDNLIASRISLKLLLSNSHFNNIGTYSHGHDRNTYTGQGMHSMQNFTSNNNSTAGSLVLRCIATIDELYQEYKEVELGTIRKDPVPARVTLPSDSSMDTFFSSYFFSASSSASACFVTNHSLSCLALISVFLTCIRRISCRNLRLMAPVSYIRSRNMSIPAVSAAPRRLALMFVARTASVLFVKHVPEAQQSIEQHASEQKLLCITQGTHLLTQG